LLILSLFANLATKYLKPSISTMGSEKKVKDKKEKKEKRSEVDGVKKSKKDKKEKKLKLNGDVADVLEAELEKEPEQSIVRIVKGEDDVKNGDILVTALVPFAEPLAEDAKEVKKILRTVKKCKFLRVP
jgi:H/ACA ribonucleoprotein complex subunit 2